MTEKKLMPLRICVDCQEEFQPVGSKHVRCGSINRKLGCSYKHHIVASRERSRERSRNAWLKQKLTPKEKKGAKFIPDYANETIIKVN